jgi:hypothetical protein
LIGFADIKVFASPIVALLRQSNSHTLTDIVCNHRALVGTVLVSTQKITGLLQLEFVPKYKFLPYLT